MAKGSATPVYCLSHCPAEKGIETKNDGKKSSVLNTSLSHCPAEKGIETMQFTFAHSDTPIWFISLPC